MPGARLLRLAVPLVLMVLNGCSPADQDGPKPVDSRPESEPDLSLLSGRIWRVAGAPSTPAPGAIFIFLANGMLLETSCVETYRIATWTIGKETPPALRVMEDGQLAFTAEITELTNSSLRLRQVLVRSHEVRLLTLAAVEGESVCPDLPK